MQQIDIDSFFAQVATEVPPAVATAVPPAEAPPDTAPVGAPTQLGHGPAFQPLTLRRRPAPTITDPTPPKPAPVAPPGLPDPEVDTLPQMAMILGQPLSVCHERQRYGRIALVEYHPMGKVDPIACIPLVPLSQRAVKGLRKVVQAQLNFERWHRDDGRALYQAGVKYLPDVFTELQAKLTPAEAGAFERWWRHYLAKPARVDGVVGLDAFAITGLALICTLFFLGYAWVLRETGMAPMYVGLTVIIDAFCGYYLARRKGIMARIPALPGVEVS